MNNNRSSDYSEEFLKRKIEFSQDYSNSLSYRGSYTELFGAPKDQAKDEGIDGDFLKDDTRIKPEANGELLRKIKEFHRDLILSGPPKLSEKAEHQLNSNYTQLVVAEGNLHASVPEGKSFYITSCFPKEGKTTVSISLAYGLSMFANRKVLLIDSHFTAPCIHLFFNVKYPTSLLEILSDNSLITKYILPTYYENLFILPHTKKIIKVEGLKKSALKTFLQAISNSFDFIIFDGRSILSAPEPILFAEIIDAIIFAVECERTKWEVLQAGIEKVLSVKGRIGGVVLNKRKFYIPAPIYKLL